MEILWKGTDSPQFQANRPKLCGDCAFKQNFHTRKLDEITLFFAVTDRLNRNLHVILKFTKRPKTPVIILKKHGFLWSESGICRRFSCFSGWNKRWYASIYKETEQKMNRLTSRILLQKASSYKYQFCSKVFVFFQGWSLKFKWWLGKI